MYQVYELIFLICVYKQEKFSKAPIRKQFASSWFSSVEGAQDFYFTNKLFRGFKYLRI